MSDHACDCDHGPATPTRLLGAPRQPQGPPRARPVTAGDTVGAVAQRSPRARELMDRLGLNHCCGAHLTLAEAAATAGLSIDDVVRSLNQALAGAA